MPNLYPYNMVITVNARSVLVPVRAAVIKPYKSGTIVPVQTFRDRAGTAPYEYDLNDYPITNERGEAFFYIGPGRVRFDVDIDSVTTRQIEDHICDCDLLSAANQFGLSREEYVIDIEPGTMAIIPNGLLAGWQVYGVNVLVEETIPGDLGFTGFDVGLQNPPESNNWGDNISPLQGTQTTIADFKVSNPVNITSNKDLVFRARGGSFTGGGRLAVTVRYITF